MPDRMNYEKPQSVESGQMKFHKIEGYDLEVGNAAQGSRNRIMLIRSLPINNYFEHVTDTNIVLAGSKTKGELHRLLSDHGRPTVKEMIPGSMGSQTYTKLRKFLGLSK